MTVDPARQVEEKVHLPLALEDLERTVDALDQVEIGAARARKERDLRRGNG